MIRAVLFDLDDTLLSLNLTAFVARYAKGASELLAEASRQPTARVFAAYVRAFLAVEQNDGSRALTNEQLFNEAFLAGCGVPLDDPAVADLIAYFEHDMLPDYREGIVRACPREGARAAVDQVWDLGLACALATNPTFSLTCDKVRMAWAGVWEDDFARISTWSNSTRVKPHAAYYQEFVEPMGLRLEECLMVGNDSKRDFARPACGLRTAYVGHAHPQKAVWSGTLAEFAVALPRIVDELDAADARK